MGQGPGSGNEVLLQLSAGDRIVVFIIIALGLALKALILWWLYEDTTNRDQRPHEWLVAALFLDIPTLVVWLFVRPPHPDDPVTPKGTRAPGTPHRESRGIDPHADPSPDPLEGSHRGAPPMVEVNEPPAGAQEILLTCPQCSTRFYVERTRGPRRIECPQCGQSGTLPGSARDDNGD